MTDEERFSLLISIMGVNTVDPVRDKRIPEGVAISAGYTPSVLRFGVPALQSTDDQPRRGAYANHREVPRQHPRPCDRFTLIRTSWRAYPRSDAHTTIGSPVSVGNRLAISKKSWSASLMRQLPPVRGSPLTRLDRTNR